jgi:hypothetical protein
MMPDQPRPYNEPLRVTLKRTVGIALVVGAALTIPRGRFAQWPIATLLVLWPSFGGHWVEVFFLNVVRPALPPSSITRAVARVAVWFIGGIVLAAGMKMTATLLNGVVVTRFPALWWGGPAFIGVELVTHGMARLRGQPGFFGGQR